MNATATFNDTFGRLATLPAQVMALKDEFARRPMKFEGEIEFSNGTVDLSQREVRYSNGETSPLSGREVALLQYLADHPGRIITREELLLSVWRMNPQFVITRTDRPEPYWEHDKLTARQRPLRCVQSTWLALRRGDAVAPFNCCARSAAETTTCSTLRGTRNPEKGVFGRTSRGAAEKAAAINGLC
jgi:hypothetical protein